jgi:hypothetical protein
MLESLSETDGETRSNVIQDFLVMYQFPPEGGLQPVARSVWRIG